MGSMNFSIHPAARRIRQWRHDWEKPHIEGMEDLIFRNTFRDIRRILKLLGGIGPDPENLVFMKTTADRLFGDGYRFSVLGAGRHQMSLLTVGAVLGGNVRVGLEDSLYLGRGQLARSCAEQVRKIRRILEELSLDIATPDEARAMLGLKGRQAIAF
jgi:uncharacterized protein (DUF849 family)